jgi:RNA polymerase sigma factor (sigma-70 family)
MNESEFTALMVRHAGLIHKLAYAYCREPEARQDLVQEIAVQLWRARHRYDARFRHSTWIYRIALNVAVSFYRRERRHRDQVEAIGDLDTGDHGWLVVEQVTPSEELQWLQRCIDELSPLDKTLALLYLEDLDHAEIAEVLGISVSNVGTKIARMKDRLRAVFERHAMLKAKEAP